MLASVVVHLIPHRPLEPTHVTRRPYREGTGPDGEASSIRSAPPISSHGRDRSNMPKRAVITLVSATLSLVSQAALAGPFRMACYFASQNCGREVVDIVSERFTARYPSANWEIVVLAEFTPYAGGGGVGYAIAGVSRRQSGANGQALVPKERFVSTSRRNGAPVSPTQAAAETVEVVRHAVEQLMVACERSPNCNVD